MGKTRIFAKPNLTKLNVLPPAIVLVKVSAQLKQLFFTAQVAIGAEICGSVMEPAYGIDGSINWGPCGDIIGSACTAPPSWPDMAALCWKLVINMAACSILKPSVPSPYCSSGVSSSSGSLDGPPGDALLPPVFLRLESLCSGTPPSFAWTVRSCRSSRSRLTNVLLHLPHLNGRSLVSVARRS